jgi:hypothetical protein
MESEMSSDSNEKLTLPEAQEGFLNIVRKLNDSDSLKQLLDWIQWNWLNGNHCFLIATLNILFVDKNTSLYYGNQLFWGSALQYGDQVLKPF